MKLQVIYITSTSTHIQLYIFLHNLQLYRTNTKKSFIWRNKTSYVYIKVHYFNGKFLHQLELDTLKFGFNALVTISSDPGFERDKNKKKIVLNHSFPAFTYMFTHLTVRTKFNKQIMFLKCICTEQMFSISKNTKN